MRRKFFKGEKSVINFYSNWSESCETMRYQIKKVVNFYKNSLNFYESNIDLDPLVIKKFKISKVPTIIFFKNSREIHRSYGYKKKKRLIILIRDHLMYE
ncbi:thioredoxin family protein [Candidatus Vidania fulgoroideorum]